MADNNQNRKDKGKVVGVNVSTEPGNGAIHSANRDDLLLIGEARKNLHSIGKGEINDLATVMSILNVRQKALSEAIDGLENNSRTALTTDQEFILAATDLFVEKAQMVLTRRSNRLIWAGMATIFLTFGILLGTTGFLVWQLSIPIKPNLSVNELILRIFQSIAFSAYILVAVKYLISLGRSFYHEASSLRERRHALRFGRLFMYQRKGEVTLEELQEAFQWNMISTSSFQDMKPAEIAETLLHKVLDGAAVAGKAGIESITKAKQP
jgi:hypothetical protein